MKQLRERYGAVLAEHARLLREAFAAHGGEEVDTQGDAFFYVFSRARDAAAAAAAGQRALAAHAWPDGAEFRVRMGMHTGEPVLSDEGRYHGMGVHRTARIMSAGHGGQVLASQATASVLADDELDGITLRDLGEHNLKDLDRPERISQLEIAGLPAEFAPLKTDAPATAADELAAPRAPVYRRPLVIGAFAGVVAAAVAIPIFAFGGGSSGKSLSALSANSVGVVARASGTIDDEVSGVPTPTRVASGPDAIWVTGADANSIYRIDASSHELRQTIKVGDGPTGIAVGAGDVWVANSLAGTVSRIDQDANAVVGDPIIVGNNPTAVAFGARSIWVTNVDDETVSRIDPKTGGVTNTIDVGAAGRGIAVGGGGIWVSDSAQNRLVRVDPKANAVSQTIGVGSGPTAVAFGAGAVWVANTLDGTLSRIDPVSNQVRATIPVGASPGAIAVNDDAVWVANEAGRTLVRVDPKSGGIVYTVQTGARPTGLTLAGSLWVAGQAATGAHRGGRLVANLLGGDTRIDPATNYDPTGWAILSITNDGLAGFKRAGGSEGDQLVPDLAASLPTPTDGGRTYTFQLRKGLRYSTGALVKASDVRSTFERLFMAGSPRLDYYAGIVGGSQCLKHSKACNLSGGIAVDDGAGTVTFHLTKPDAEFLYKLAIPFGYILPAGTPASGAPTLAATGPYVLLRHTGKRFHLVRNRHFRVWSEIAKPDGYPDEIEATYGLPFERTASNIERNRVDLGSAQPGSALTQFETQHPAQVHTTPVLGTFYWYLNTATPPFDNLQARKAVAYALDRDALVRAAGGREAAQATCQVLPPNLTGYRPYCPYTVNAGAGGAWTAPDPARARALVRASGTAGARVSFWFGAPPPEAAAIRRVARTLFASLGYRVSVKYFNGFGSYYGALGKTSGTAPQAGTNGWVADYPAPSNFFSVLRCSFVHDAGTNASHFCSRTLEREIDRALSLQSRDQAAAARLWTKIDRDATDQVGIVPTFTPRSVDIVSRRVGNYQRHPLFGVLLDQLWVK